MIEIDKFRQRVIAEREREWYPGFELSEDEKLLAEIESLISFCNRYRKLWENLSWRDSGW